MYIYLDIYCISLFVVFCNGAFVMSKGESISELACSQTKEASTGA